MRIVADRRELRAALGDAAPGLVPTMGALHDGHLALIRRSAAENRLTVVSVFVNPTQFNESADFAAYPRDLARDSALAAEAGADLVFAPDVAAIYPPDFATSVEVRGAGERWEGAARPGHFRGVATVVTILLNLVRPARSYFGEKDYQQLVLVRRLHADLALPGEIVGCPTVRAADGLALSSRNARLSAQERQQAGAIPRALFALGSAFRAGERDAERLTRVGEQILDDAPALTIDYLAIVDPATLEPLATAGEGARTIVAARIGGVRLIDNIALVAGDP